MNYVEKTNVTFAELDQRSYAAHIPDQGVFERTFDYKDAMHDSDTFASISSRLDLASMTDVDQKLFASRIVGGLTVRLALASERLAAEGRIDTSFDSLSDDDQAQALHDMAILYADAAETKLDQSNGSAIDLLSADYALTGPLSAVSHRFVRDQLHGFKASQRTVGDRIRNIASYANVIPGTYPPGGFKDASVGSPDSVLVQAFGRNDMLDSELPIVRDMRATLGDEQSMMEYLDAQQFDAGESNRSLAQAVETQLAGAHVIEPIVQWEVAHALWQRDPETFKKYQRYMHVLYPHSSFYPTYEVKADSVEIMDTLGMHNPLELAHQDMAVRAMGILARLGVQADLLQADVPFDAHSKQFQTRGPGQWILRETLTRVEHVVRGRINL